MKKPDLIEIKQRVPALYLTWVLNNICTNQCSYCPPVLHSGKNHHYDWNDARNFSEYLIKKYPKIQLAISGGEPTLSPFLPDLIDMFDQAEHPIGITSNGSRTVRYYETIVPKLNYICLSYHPSFKDPNFLEKAVACSKHALTVVHIMMDSRYFDECVEFYHELSKHDAIVAEIVRINDWIKDSIVGRDYSEEQIKIIETLPRNESKKRYKNKRKNLIGADFYYSDNSVVYNGSPQVLMNEQTNVFKGWSCNIGLESLFVHYHGGIQRANCAAGEPVIIGNINDLQNVAWQTEPLICYEPACVCTTDICVSKKKI